MIGGRGERRVTAQQHAVRAKKLERGTEVLLSDTVGFVRDLPHNLIASFRATLRVELPGSEGTWRLSERTLAGQKSVLY